MYICYNSFFDGNPYRNDYEDDHSIPECPYFETYMRQMPPFPPPGTPSGGPGFNPPQGPSGAPGYSVPSGAPPTFTPSKAQAQPKAISGGAIKPCTFRYVYLWLNNGRSFWAWLVYVDRRSASGWRWTGRRWVYFGIDLRRIDSFVCY